MRNKIIGIVVLMLVATTVVSATNINVNETYQTKSILPGLNYGVDQKQDWLDGYGLSLNPPYAQAQSFTPTKNTLTAVSLALFKYGTPSEPVEITVLIRESLTGSNLATKTIDTSVVTISKARWVLFDFEDISVTPGSKYFIICSGNGGNDTNAYCWGYTTERDKYANGDAWGKDNETSNWYMYMGNALEPDDFCFKTYYKKPISSNENLINPVFYFILERAPNTFPLLRQLMGY